MPRRGSYHHVDELTGHHDDAAHRLVRDELAHVLIRERRLTHARLITVHRNADTPAQLAVHLQDDLHRLLHQGLAVDDGPGLINQRGGVAETVPQGMTHVGRNGREYQCGDLQRLLAHGTALRA